jgi:dTMP kinase
VQSVRNGLLVTFEGTEGAGKSTLTQAVAAQLRQSGYRVTLTREPGGSPVAEKIRKIILEEEMSPWAELFLYEAARAEHLENTVLPALSRGEIVLCDRFTDSTLAYQSYARGLPWAEVKALNRVATRGLKPHLTVLLDIDPATGLKRVVDPNRFEAEGVLFQTRVRKGFLKAKSQEPGRWMVVRADSGAPPELARQVVEKLTRKFKSRLKAHAKKGES